MPEKTFKNVPIDEVDDHIRAIVHEEIASLAGLALRRTQDRDWTRSPDRNLAMEVANEEAAQFWGEVLAQYSGGTLITEDGKTVGISFPDESSTK